MQALAGNTVVAEVAVHVGEVRQAVVLGAEAQVALLVEPSCHGRAVGHQHPLPYVKLPAGPHTLSAAQVGMLLPATIGADAVPCMLNQFQSCSGMLVVRSAMR